jgi:hypothetical protein
MADWMATGTMPNLPAIVRGMGRKFPLAPLRLKYLRAGIAMKSWLDRRS